MKAFILIILALGGVFLFILNRFSSYEVDNIMYNQAVFELYFDVQKDELEDYFSLPTGTLDSGDYKVICKLPVEPKPFNPQFVELNPLHPMINCNEQYDEDKHVKFEPYELKGVGSKVYLLKDYFRSISMFSEKLSSKNIVRTKSILLDYKKGELNKLVIAKDGVYDYCK